MGEKEEDEETEYGDYRMVSHLNKGVSHPWLGSDTVGIGPTTSWSIESIALSRKRHHVT